MPELEPPPFAAAPGTTEILRVWTKPNLGQQLTLHTYWADPGAWGLVLVDLVEHVVNAYRREGNDAEVTRRRIYQLFDAERNNRTDTPFDITD